MVRWTRKLTWRDRADDWLVIRDGLVVGRVFYDTAQNPFRYVWGWSVITMPAAQGYADTLDEGLETVRSRATDNWSHKLNGPSR